MITYMRVTGGTQISKSRFNVLPNVLHNSSILECLLFYSRKNYLNGLYIQN